MKKTAPLSIRITPDLKEALETLAAADRRPLSSYVQLALEEHVARQQASVRKGKGTR
jgi:predicted transcriptional regulator